MKRINGLAERKTVQEPSANPDQLSYFPIPLLIVFNRLNLPVSRTL